MTPKITKESGTGHTAVFATIFRCFATQRVQTVCMVRTALNIAAARTTHAAVPTLDTVLVSQDSPVDTASDVRQSLFRNIFSTFLTSL